MITRKAVARELYIGRAWRAGVTIDGAVRAFEDPADSPGVIEAYDDADAVIALIWPELPAQRDERAEKLGEQLDAMAAEVNANHRTIRGLVAVVRDLEEKLKNERDERAERPGELLGATERQLAQELANLSATAERCHVLEERARNSEALAANLRRVDNERAIELMRVKRELAAAQAAQHDALAALGVMREALEDGLRRHEKFVREHALDTSKYPDAYIHVIRRALSLINHA